MIFNCPNDGGMACFSPRRILLDGFHNRDVSIVFDRRLLVVCAAVNNLLLQLLARSFFVWYGEFMAMHVRISDLGTSELYAFLSFQPDPISFKIHCIQMLIMLCSFRYDNLSPMQCLFPSLLYRLPGY